MTKDTTTQDMEINFSKEFTDAPGGRYKTDGSHSGELFYETLLLPRFEESLKKNEKLIVNMDNFYGVPASFASQAFGTLSQKFGSKKVLDNLVIKTNLESRRNMIVSTIIDPAGKMSL